MKPKTARRFLKRNEWRLLREDEMPPSFYKRVERAKEALNESNIKS